MRANRSYVWVMIPCVVSAVAWALTQCKAPPYSHSERFSSVSRDGIRLAVTGQCTRGICLLTFEISNRSTRVLSTPARFLPWGENAANWGPVPVLAVEAFDVRRKPLVRVQPVSDIGPDTLAAIAPGETVKGTLPLNNLFLSIPESIAKGPLMVRWTYRMIGNTREGPFEGQVQIGE
jgi:hypothetical protein